jgi:chromosome segregation ATPase
MDEGFVDLRQHSYAGSGADSFWPSFTDIMMVVVMIFMIASTVLMLRNWDLVQELRATIEAERKAEALARFATETSATLEEQLAQAQHLISELRMRLMQANEIDEEKTRQLADRERRLLVLQSDKQRLAASLQQSRRETRLGEDRLAQVQAEQTRLAEAHATQRERLQEVLGDLERIEQTSQEQAMELAGLRQQRSLAEQQLLSLQGEYDEIKIKYDKLVRPARSAVGKFVVAVRYLRKDGKQQISLKEMDEDKYRPVSRQEMHQRLAALKEEYRGSLYVKIIIPEDSGLSYSEASSFTFDLLGKYDYYHQDAP